MAISLALAATDTRLEAIYTWLEQHGGSQVQLWGRENQRRAALLAYSDGPNDSFGWSNWVSKADDPSEILPSFDDLELIAEDQLASALNASFLGVFTVRAGAVFS